MLRRWVLVFIFCVSTIIAVSCSNLKGEETTKTELVYEKLSSREEYLMNLTGNQLLTYKFKNIPRNKKYEILLSYEVYEGDKKIKEDNILGIISDDPSDKEKDTSIGLNFKDNKIRYVIMEAVGAYSSGEYDMQESINEYSRTYLTQNVKLEAGTEIYIYYATSSDSIRTNIPLGIPINTETTSDILKDSKSTILIKLSFNEKS